MTRSRRVTDLSLVVGFVVLAALTLLIVPGVPRAVEWAVAIPLVLVAPGYTVVAALFPTDPSEGHPAGGHLRSPGWTGRVAILLVSSVLAVAVVGIGLSLVGALSLGPVVLVLAGGTLVGVVVARFRRRHLAAGQRADPLVGVRSLPAQSGLSALQTVTLAVGMLALVGAVAVAGTSTTSTTSFSEASLLAGEDTDALLGSDGTVTYVAGESNAVALRVQNHEGTETTYHFVGTLQRVAANGTVLESQRVDTGEGTVPAGTSTVFHRQITPSTTGDSLRLQYQVYAGSSPSEPGSASADITLRHWVRVIEAGR